jgi:hypothetical protein
MRLDDLDLDDEETLNVLVDMEIGAIEATAAELVEVEVLISLSYELPDEPSPP